MSIDVVGFRNGDLNRVLFDSQISPSDDLPDYLIGKTLYRNGPGYYMPGAEHWSVVVRAHCYILR
jgi:hypothetical protein